MRLLSATAALSADCIVAWPWLLLLVNSKDLTLEQAKQVRKDGGWEALAECCSERWSWVARVEAMTGLGNMFIVTPKEGLRVAEKVDLPVYVPKLSNYCSLLHVCAPSSILIVPDRRSPSDNDGRICNM